MLSKKQAIAVYHAAGIQVMKVHEEELRALTEQTGNLLLFNMDDAVAKRLHKRVRLSHSLDDAITTTMEVFATELRSQGAEPMRAILDYRQALGTVMELASSKYGEPDKVEEVAREMDNRMLALLHIDEP